jgi:hypothetical protein
MERENLVERLLSHVSETDRLDEPETLRQISNARVFERENRVGTTRVTTTTAGSCSPERLPVIQSATTQALSNLDRAVALTDAFIAAPNNPANAPAAAAFNRHFKSSAANITTYVRAILNNIRTDIRTLTPFTIECHDAWDSVCGAAGAYIPAGEAERLVFCSAFFTGTAPWRAETIVHEMAHTQVGNTPITDRAYARDRLLQYLSTAEALTNAESYGMYVDELSSGHPPTTTAPGDSRHDCPNDWWQLLQPAMARAQRANRNAQVVFSTLTPNGLQNWTPVTLRLLGGSTQADIDRAKNVYNKAETELGSSIDIECEPGGGGRCDSADTYWYALGHFHVCPSWKNQASEEERIISLLAGLYGYFGAEDDNARRNSYARLSQQLTTERWGIPALPDVLGNPAWRSSALRIQIGTIDPQTPGQVYYTEDGSSHGRMSSRLPLYKGPDFRDSTLPFKIHAYFSVDYQNQPRPAPFTPPAVNALLEFNSQQGAFRHAEQDPRADYTSPGTTLHTSFPAEFSHNLRGNGELHMHFEMIDKDSGVTLVYDDLIHVETDLIRDIITPPSNTQMA